MLQLVLLLALGFASAEWREGAAEQRLRELDTPFHFLLRIEGYRVERLARDSDTFSTWGDLTLRRRVGGGAGASASLLRAARKAGWRQIADEAVDIDADRLASLGIPPGHEALDLAQSAGRRSKPPPTRYGCRVWIVDDGKRIVVAYRVDAE